MGPCPQPAGRSLRSVVVALAILATALSPAEVRAQEPERRVLSLEEALRLATGRSERVAIALAEVAGSEGRILQAGSERWPQLTAGASYTHTFLTEFDDIFEVEPGAAPVDGGGVGDDLFGQGPFGPSNTWRLDLGLSQILFAGGRIRAMVAAERASRRAAILALDQEEAAVVLRVAEAYLEAQLAGRLREIAEATVALARRTLERAELAVVAGTQAEFEALRARVSVDNAGMELIRAERDQELALLRLRQLLELPEDLPLDLASALAPDPGLAAVAGEAAGLTAPADAVPRRAVQEASAAVEVAERALTVARSTRWPTVEATSRFGFVAYPEEIWPPVDGEEWRENWTAGVGLTVPLFTGFRIRGDIRVAAADLARQRAQLDLVEELADLDSADALAELTAARAAWAATAGTVEQALRAWQIAEARYESGISSQLEVTDVRLQLQHARANRARAARDLQLAELRLALLPALPLQETGGVVEPPPEPAVPPARVMAPAPDASSYGGVAPTALPSQ